ncbi:MAG: ATP-binding protein [Candidatus Aminicenantes bacterium]|nr:ATP-binding protein [Candidatus Aminicenantes bacterium]
MIKRHLEAVCLSPEIGRQMLFITGPRQAGKTTLARHMLAAAGSGSLYYNWDLREIRDKYKIDPSFFESAMREVKSRRRLPWICFDEVHKMPSWKNLLKGVFDKFEDECRFIVTGSARLEWMRRAGDSLAGRYFLYHLNPLMLAETAGRAHLEPAAGESAQKFIERKLESRRPEQALLEQLIRFSGFPEPLIKADMAFYHRWQREMVDTLTREDVRDLTRILAVEHVATLMQLLPERVGSPLSLNSVKEDVEISYTAVRNAVRAMELTYALFLIPPYSRNIARAVKKEKKCYFYDWGRCRDLAKRFENYVALGLKSSVELWHDKGIADFAMNYVRTKDGKETDFLISRDGKPWCLFEAKLKAENIARHHFDQARALGGIPFVQLVHEPHVYKKPAPGFWCVSAGRFY